MKPPKERVLRHAEAFIAAIEAVLPDVPNEEEALALDVALVGLQWRWDARVKSARALRKTLKQETQNAAQ